MQMICPADKTTPVQGVYAAVHIKRLRRWWWRRRWRRRLHVCIRIYIYHNNNNINRSSTFCVTKLALGDSGAQFFFFFEHTVYITTIVLLYAKYIATCEFKPLRILCALNCCVIICYHISFIFIYTLNTFRRSGLDWIFGNFLAWNNRCSFSPNHST